jgi:hypothetical protein
MKAKNMSDSFAFLNTILVDRSLDYDGFLVCLVLRARRVVAALMRGNEKERRTGGKELDEHGYW